MKDVLKITYDVYVPSELSAGLRGFSDTITVTVESGDPGGTKEEFIEHIRESLAEWYDGATIHYYVGKK